MLTPERIRRGSQCSTPDRTRRDGDVLTPTYRRSSLGAGLSIGKLAELQEAVTKSQGLLSQIRNKLGCLTDDGRKASFGSQDVSSRIPSEDLSHLNEQLLQMQTLLSSALVTEGS